MEKITNIEDAKKNESYKLTEQDKQSILDTMQREVEQNENLKILASLPSNNGVEERVSNDHGETKLVNVSVDAKSGEKTILGPVTEVEEKISTAAEDFVSSLEKTDLDTHYDIVSEDIKKVASEEGAFGKFDISDETSLELLKVIEKYKAKGKINYVDLPSQVKGFIDNYLMNAGFPSNPMVLHNARNEYANMLIDEYINQIEINKWSDDFNIQMEKFSDDMKKEMSPLYKELNEHREQYLEDIINGFAEEEKKEKAQAILASIRDAFALTRLKEAAPKIKIKNFDIEKPQREFSSIMQKYVSNQYHIYDLAMVTNTLHRHLQKLKLISKEDTTTAIRFVVAFCKYCKNYKTTNAEEHAFMYFVTYNVILLDIYNGETYDNYSKEFLANVLEVVNSLK